MNYLLYSDTEISLEQAKITGLFQWANAFGGKIGKLKEDELDELDIVHVNVTGTGFSSVGHAREAIGYNSKTKIVANIDYGVELWDSAFKDPRLLLREIDKADLIFHVEPKGAGLLSNLLGRHVEVIPHPADLEYLESFSTEERAQAIFVLCHRWDGAYFCGWAAVKEFTKMKSVIGTGMTEAETQGSKMKEALPLFDEHLQRLPNAQYLEVMSHMYVAVDTYRTSSYGRTQIECAALGVPCVSPTCVESGNVIFEDITYEPGTSSRSVVLRLLSDQDFYQDVVELARERVGYYGLGISRERMLSALGMLKKKESGNGLLRVENFGLELS